MFMYCFKFMKRLKCFGLNIIMSLLWICYSGRSGASGGGIKLEPMSSPAGSTARITFKSEQEKLMLSRDVSAGPIKERPLGKVNVKYVSPLVILYSLDIIILHT